jgi:hypothetical protein
MAARVNPYVKRIASLVDEQDTNRAIQVFVKRKRSPQQSLDALARSLGVTAIVEERLPFEGGLFELEGGKLLIKLNSLSSVARRRFTLAHEIAHLLLGTVPAFRKAHGSDVALESACDSVAAELLMPSEEGLEFVRQLGAPAPEKLQVVASKYSVSLQAAAIRVHSDFKLWKCCVGFWELDPDIKTRWFVGKRRWDRVEPDSYSFELAVSATRAVKSTELWQTGPYSDPVSLNLLHLGNDRVLGLVDSAR